MKKFSVGASFFVLVLVCILTKNFLLLLNYVVALILHELAHVFVAGKRGYKLKSFKLDMFGVAVELDNQIDDHDNFAINIAGPMLNLFLCLLCLASYAIYPPLIIIFHSFCLCNLVLAIFNLLPVYPLDGGKIFRGIIKDNKTYKHLDFIIRLTLCLLFLILFIISIFKTINLFYLLMCLFFLTAKRDTTPKFSLIKQSKHKKFDRVVMLKIEGNNNLYEILKLIKHQHYTIFYYKSTSPKYLDEDEIVNLSLHHPLTTQIKDINL